MVNLLSRVFEARLDVLSLKIGIALEDFRLGGTGRKHVEHVFYADAHAPDTRSSGALLGIERDAVHLTHSHQLRWSFVFGKRAVAVIYRVPSRKISSN
jgi:hypothetical protein